MGLQSQDITTVAEQLLFVNRHAGRLSEKASRTGAEKTVQRKDALYSLKADVLCEIEPVADLTEKHIIDGSHYYYFEFESFKFHIPVDNFIGDPEYSAVEELQSFNKSSTVPNRSPPLQHVLTFFAENGFNVNSYISNSAYVWPKLCKY